MNPSNTKFTFNKKSFALSLACVGMLATSADAYTIKQGTSFATSAMNISNQSSSIEVGPDSATNSTSNHITTSKLEIDMSKAGDKSLEVKAGAFKDGLKDLVISGSTVSGAVTIGDTLTSLTFKNDATFKNTITINAGIGTIGSLDKTVTISGGTTGFLIGENFKVGTFLAKDFTTSGDATGINNKGTIDKIIIGGSLKNVGGGSSAGDSIVNSGKIGMIEIKNSSASEITIQSSQTSVEVEGINNETSGTIQAINIDVKSITIGHSGASAGSGSAVLIENEGGTITNGINIKTKEKISLFASGATTDTSYLIEQSGGAIKGGITITADDDVELGKKADKNGNVKLVYISGGSVEGDINLTAKNFKIAGSGADSGILLHNQGGTINDNITIKTTSKIELEGSGAKSVSIINNTGTILGTVTFDATIEEKSSSSGSAILNTGKIGKFVNKGTITGAQISGGTIYTFVNEGLISGSSVFGGGHYTQRL